MKALNRKEVLVNAKANGTLDSFKPLTRDEAFTKKALGLGGGSGGGTTGYDMIFVLPETENLSNMDRYDISYECDDIEKVHAKIKNGEMLSIVVKYKYLYDGILCCSTICPSVSSNWTESLSIARLFVGFNVHDNDNGYTCYIDWCPKMNDDTPEPSEWGIYSLGVVPE